jgi:uncharacterized protein
VRLPDANVLIYASDARSSHHARARKWLEMALSGTETVGFAMAVVVAFVRISTHPRIANPPLAPSEAFDVVDEWLTQPPATLLHPGRRHLALLRELVEESGTAGNLTGDAHLAALAIEHGGTLASFDGDFHRFGGLALEYLR